MQTQHLKYFFIAVLLISVQCTYGFNLGFKDVIKSGKDITIGVAKSAYNAVPTPNEFFDIGKQALAGYPLEIAANCINQVCSAALAAKAVTPRITPNINKMNFQLMKACKNYTFPLTEPSKMWESEHFDPSKKVVIFATGWSNTINDSVPMKNLRQPYLCRDDVNFIVVDAANFLDTLYTWSAFNTEEVGKNIAIGLVYLIKTVPVEKVHLIGHSLGSHIMGAAGRFFTEFTNKTVPRITGLDPAKPCFKEGESLSGLLRGDADFIDVIHSNPGILGRRDSIGDADFYPGGLTPIAPGTLSFIESHGRAVEYFAESAYPGNEKLYLGVRCTSLTRLVDGKCKGEKVAMGYAAPRSAKGNFFMEINGEIPYGQELPKTEALKNKKCGICEEDV